MIGRFGGRALAVAGFVLCGVVPAFANGPMASPTMGTTTTYRPQNYGDPTDAAAAAEAAATLNANQAAINGQLNPYAAPTDPNAPPPTGASPDTTAVSPTIPSRSVVVRTSQASNGDILRETIVDEYDPTTGIITETVTVRDMTTGMPVSRQVQTNSAQKPLLTQPITSSITYYHSDNTEAHDTDTAQGPVTTTTTTVSGNQLRKQTLQQLGIGQ